MKEIYHYGTPRKSGRYPWGSGGDPQQRSTAFLGYVSDLKSQGLTDVQIAQGMGMSTTELRAQKSLAKTVKRQSDSAQALRLKDKGLSNVAIGDRMGINESSVRNLLKPVLIERNNITQTTANMLKNSVDKKGYIDVGSGVEQYVGVSRTRLNTAIQSLKDEGYVTHNILVEQLGTGKKTTVKVLAPPGTEWKDVAQNKDKIQLIQDHSYDGGRSYLGLEPIKSISPKKVQIVYAEDGGTEKDGVMEIRRDAKGLSMGNSRYAQVRIGVNDTHYLKGMAMYADDLPDGVDIRFNTNKAKGTPMLGPKDNTVLKHMKKDKDGNIDMDNPFGATIKRGGQKGHLNIVNEEGDWAEWSKTLSSQVLSKQPPELAKKQLNLALTRRKDELDEIMAMTNPAVRKKLLDAYADGADSAAVSLKAAAMPRQGSHVILPFPGMKETEVYAPNYKNGEKVVLIRYPHGGKFEIPELTVNNKFAKAKSLIQNAKDAIGINSKVAERLSGADFDGDTVMVIPNNSKGIKTSSPLKGLEKFDPQEAYKAYDGMTRMTPRQKGIEMGSVSNLITDMTIGGASNDELARAVRHSMVVIDAEKHNLNYKQSYLDNGIAGLKTRYQGSARSGAATLVSKASSEYRVDARKEGIVTVNPKTGKTKRIYIDPETGKKLYTKTGENYVDKNGKTVYKKTKSTKMAEVDDAFELSSGTTMETIYATHANGLKALANQARKEYVATENVSYSPSAKKAYEKEITTLKAKLDTAVSNKPLERQAQLIANTTVDAKKKANPNMEAGDLKKVKWQALDEARNRLGAGKQLIDITPKEWEAIQAGGVSNNVLTQILNNTDLDKVKSYATPRTSVALPTAKLNKAKAMLAVGRTQAEVADALGVSTTTLSNALGKE